MKSGIYQIIGRAHYVITLPCFEYSEVFQVGIPITYQVVKDHQRKELLHFNHCGRNKFLDQFCYLFIAVFIFKIRPGRLF